MVGRRTPPRPDCTEVAGRYASSVPFSLPFPGQTHVLVIYGFNDE